MFRPPVGVCPTTFARRDRLGEQAPVSLNTEDWHYAGQFDRSIDLASAIWSCEYNGYATDAPIAVLHSLDWPRQDAAEVKRLSRIWAELAGTAD